jgi:hypothetical protein
MRACSVSEQEFHSPLGRRTFLQWRSRWWRGQHESGSPSFSISTHSGDKMKPGAATSTGLLHRLRSSVIRHTINSNSTNTICGCLLSAQSVIHSERSQTRPLSLDGAETRAVITRA